MNCPLEFPENSQALLDYSAGKLDPQHTSAVQQHLAVCPACREFTAGQLRVWDAMDAWEAPPVSADFNRRLYARIDQDVSIWQRIMRPFRPLMVHRGLPIAAAACLLVMAGVLIERPTARPVVSRQLQPPSVESVQPEQVEQALDAMDMLGEFSHTMRSAPTDSKL